MRELSLNNCRLDKRYDIQGQLGRGSYAEIYVARDVLSSPQSPHNLVVIKALNVFLQDDLDADLERTLVENFQNEAIALDRVRHPNIISRLGHGTARDLRGTVFHYLVLEYLPGGDMHKLFREKKSTLKQSLKYIEQICAGLRHAHQHGIIHRDIKPQNLLLANDRETVKIADFGVARMTQSISPITRVGTNIYAPPEHSPMFAGQTGVLTFSELTFAADIYSLAKSIYTAVTGESPRFFANQQITELPMAVRGEEWAGELLQVLKRATSSDPRERQQTIDEFWLDLTKVRQIVEEGEIVTEVRSRFSTTPQAHVAPGYTPIAPMKPHFDTSRDLKLRHPLISNERASIPTLDSPVRLETPDNRPLERAEDYWPNQAPVQREPTDIAAGDAIKPKKKRRFLRRVAMFAIFLSIFVGILYGTGVFLRNSGILPSIFNKLKVHTATANTDIYLRPEPNTSNDPIGLVTKNSKLKIVNSQNNWYQVDVIQQGRERASTLNATRGWLNGKYIDLDDN